MTKLEYIKESHKQTNHKVWLALDGVYLRLKKKNAILAYLWMPITWICYGFVWFISWLAFIGTLFCDIKYTIYFMEFDISKQGLDNNQARAYLESKRTEYKRQLSYGNYSQKQQHKINHTFEYLLSKYPVREVKDNSLTKIEKLTQRSIIKIDTIADQIEPVSEYAKIKLDRELQEQAAEAKKQRELERRQQKIANNVPNFESKLTERHIAILTECVNEVQMFTKSLSEKDVANIFACSLCNPLQIGRNKNRLLVYLFVQLFAFGYICIEWQSVCEKNKLFFSSKESKILTAGNISSTANQVNDLPPKGHEIIDNHIKQLKQA